MKRSITVHFISFLFMSVSGLAPADIFEDLPLATPDAKASHASAISANGHVTVGDEEYTTPAQASGVRWCSCGDLTKLTQFPGGQEFSQVLDISPDGNYIVGYGQSTEGSQAFIWHRNFGLVGLGDLEGGTFDSRAFGVSAAGNVIVGWTNSANGREASRWTRRNGWTLLGKPAGPNSDSVARAVSPDGSIIAGWMSSQVGSEAFRWTAKNGMVSIQGGGFVKSAAFAISSDGTTIVGEASINRIRTAMRWTRESGMHSLGDLEGGTGTSRSIAVNRNGTIVVGFGNSQVGKSAMVWDAKNGMRELKTILENEYQVNLKDWVLSEATGISDDGKQIVGWGIKNGKERPWKVVLP